MYDATGVLNQMVETKASRHLVGESSDGWRGLYHTAPTCQIRVRYLNLAGNEAEGDLLDFVPMTRKGRAEGFRVKHVVQLMIERGLYPYELVCPEKGVIAL